MSSMTKTKDLAEHQQGDYVVRTLIKRRRFVNESFV